MAPNDEKISVNELRFANFYMKSAMNFFFFFSINSSPSSAAYLRQCFRSALVRIMACRSPIQNYLNQCWVIVNWTFSNKLQWNFNQTSKHFIHENASEYIVCKVAAISSRWRWVKDNIFVLPHQQTQCLPQYLACFCEIFCVNFWWNLVNVDWGNGLLPWWFVDWQHQAITCTSVDFFIQKSLVASTTFGQFCGKCFRWSLKYIKKLNIKNYEHTSWGHWVS